MERRFGINTACKNCGVNFFITDTDEKPISFPTPDEAHDAIRRLEFKPRSGILSALDRGMGIDTPPEKPYFDMFENYECPECRCVFKRTELTYHVARLPD